MISCKAMTKILYRNSEKYVPSYFPPEFFFMFVILISNHTVFLVQFQLFENSLVQINSKLNSKPYDYLYLGTVHFLRGRGGGLVGFGGGHRKKKTALKGGGASKKNKGKRGGGHVKYFSNALRWDMFYYS